MNMNVSLTDELARFVKTKVDSGRYATSSEVVREALLLLEKPEHEEAGKLAWLRQAYREGLDSGPAEPVDMTALKAEARRRLDAANA
jgi:antitoxin ParD1/3/4